MAFGSGPSNQGLSSEINVTPLVDVMLVMLIIFMLVTPMLQKGVGVDLPKARNVQAVPENRELIVEVVLRANGDVFIENDPVPLEAVTQLLRRRLELNPAVELHVKADRGVRYVKVKEILRCGQEAGYRGASLIAEEIRDTSAQATASGAGG